MTQVKICENAYIFHYLLNSTNQNEYYLAFEAKQIRGKDPHSTYINKYLGCNYVGFQNNKASYFGCNYVVSFGVILFQFQYPILFNCILYYQHNLCYLYKNKHVVKQSNDKKTNTVYSYLR